MHIAYTNEEGCVEYFRMDLVNNNQAFYLAKFASSVVTDTLPDAEYADCFEITGGVVVISEAKLVVRQQGELLRAIDEDTEAQKYAVIIAEGERKRDLVLAMTTLEEVNAVDIGAL